MTIPSLFPCAGLRRGLRSQGAGEERSFNLTLHVVYAQHQNDFASGMDCGVICFQVSLVVEWQIKYNLTAVSVNQSLYRVSLHYCNEN